jgi:hypothetical protein
LFSLRIAQDVLVHPVFRGDVEPSTYARVAHIQGRGTYLCDEFAVTRGPAAWHPLVSMRLPALGAENVTALIYWYFVKK